MEASQLETESNSLKLEIRNLKTTVDKQLNDLATITEELENAKNLNVEKDEIIKSEAVKFQRVIHNSNIKAESERDSLKNDIIVKNEIITSLQKDLEESNQKYESLLSQNKKRTIRQR